MNLNEINTDNQAVFCSKNPGGTTIESQEDIELSTTTLSRKLEEIEQMDASTFFSGEAGNYIDNHGAHIWFIENYKTIVTIIDSKDPILAGIAKDIILILHNIISEKMAEINPEKISIEEYSITPAKKPFNLGEEIKYLHGFLIENNGSGLIHDIENIKLYADSEIEKILQNN